MTASYLPHTLAVALDWNAFGALATAAAVGVALVHPWLSRRWNAPRLQIQFRKRDIDFNYDAQPPELRGNARFLVVNAGRGTAEKVRVTLTDLYDQQMGVNAWSLNSSFLQTGLKWTHNGEAALEVLPAKTSALCDFGRLTPNETVAPKAFELKVATEIQPRSGYDRLQAGAYIARLSISGANFEAINSLVSFHVGRLDKQMTFFSIGFASSDQHKAIARLDEKLSVPTHLLDSV